MSFEFTTMTAATLTSLTPRTEKHGDDDVFAVSFGLKITGSNTLLDKLSPTLRHALYRAVDEASDTLPGVEQATPKLRATGIEVLHLKGALNGWTIAIDHGIDEDDPIKLGDAKLDKFKVAPMEGGTVELSFRIGSNDIDATEAGLLCSKLHQEIQFTLTAPIVKKDPVIDGTTGHPGAAEGQGSLLDTEAQTPEQALAASLAPGESVDVSMPGGEDATLTRRGDDVPDDDTPADDEEGEGSAPDVAAKPRRSRKAAAH